MKEGHVRRAKLYYLRGTSGKASKVKGRIGPYRAKEEVVSAGEEEQPMEAVETSSNES